ncbi:MAG TPA: phosphohistidine phosphatase SixA [Nitrospirales bacterium]|nr:phosphohistidine phosphatase SixA [Nitrospiraceae bacterium]HNP27402.1 phosphohistidine phosphatase SixA [Nitrospirales bacterium]
MNCLLLRHGIAVSSEEWNGSERERPLTNEGITKTGQVAAGLKRIGMKPTHILCSPLIRTQQTAEITKETLQIKATIQLCPELVYDQSPILLFSILQGLPQDAVVMCVGHEPHLGQTAALMIFGKNSSGLAVKKAGACHISFEGNVGIGRGQLEWWMAPAQLRALH